MRSRSFTTVSGAPLTKLRMSSRNFPFHSFHLSLPKLPTSYRPPESHASAINFVPARIGSESISQTIGGFNMGSPDSLRENIDARSKRKPSTCISEVQYLRLSRIRRFTTE